MSSPLEEIIRLAHPTTNVIVVNGGMADIKNLVIYGLLEFEYWDDDEALGPDCHLCGKAIVDLHTPFTHNGMTYTAVFKEDLSGGDWNFDALQCIYCFNYYHKNR